MHAQHGSRPRVSRAARGVEAERASIDARMQAYSRLGRFFAAKLRASILCDPRTGRCAQRPRRRAGLLQACARNTCSSLAKTAVVYADDLSASDEISERGQWSDRLAAIDADIERMTARQATSQASGDPAADAAVAEALGHQARPPARATHQPPSSFRPGDPIPLRLKVDGAGEQTTVRCYYRHVNQAERFAAVDMTAAAGGYAETIPATYTASAYPLQYYFVVNEGTREATLFPGLGPELRSRAVLRRPPRLTPSGATAGQLRPELLVFLFQLADTLFERRDRFLDFLGGVARRDVLPTVPVERFDANDEHALDSRTVVGVDGLAADSPSPPRLRKPARAPGP